MGFFGFWAFNTAGKSVTKVGIYALPPLGGPPKWVKIEILAKKWFLIDHDPWFRRIYRDPISTMGFF
jgi:hypothetical protein